MCCSAAVTLWCYSTNDLSCPYVSGGYPQQPQGGYPQQPQGAYPRQPAPYPQQQGGPVQGGNTTVVVQDRGGRRGGGDDFATGMLSYVHH